MRSYAKDVEKNSAKQEGLKLALNSLYGKNMLSRSKETSICRVSGDDANNYLIKNHQNIKSFIECGNTTIFKEECDSLYDSNNIHIACMILDMSKRIMNEVIDVIDNNGINILYTDTDSMHIMNNNRDIEKLSDLYKKKYRRELIGKGLGQFHSDFQFAGHYNVYARKSIIIDKKVYLDIIVGTKKDENGNEIQEETYHTRYKGISETSLKEHVKYYGSLEGLYLKLIEGEKIDFDLCYGNAISFDLNGECPRSREKFIRKGYFPTTVETKYHK